MALYYVGNVRAGMWYLPANIMKASPIGHPSTHGIGTVMTMDHTGTLSVAI